LVVFYQLTVPLDETQIMQVINHMMSNLNYGFRVMQGDGFWIAVAIACAFRLKKSIYWYLKRKALRNYYTGDMKGGRKWTQDQKREEMTRARARQQEMTEEKARKAEKIREENEARGRQRRNTCAKPSGPKLGSKTGSEGPRKAPDVVQPKATKVPSSMRREEVDEVDEGGAPVDDDSKEEGFRIAPPKPVRSSSPVRQDKIEGGSGPACEANLSEERAKIRSDRATAAETRLKKQGGIRTPYKKKSSSDSSPLIGPNSWQPTMRWTPG
jgi:hypothetical protein